jgi:thiamine biosynthesis lipoprotein
MRSTAWTALGCTITVAVVDDAALGPARALLEADLAALDLCCSRFRDDSEVVRLAASGGEVIPVSPLLARLLRAALSAAAETGGDLDPTLGSRLVALGYDRDFAAVGTGPGGVLTAARTASWTDIELDVERGLVRVPDGVLLDLGATAKAYAADAAAARIAAELGTGVLVSLGGDLSVAGAVPDGGWPVLADDRPDGQVVEPAVAPQLVAVHAGGVATSSTTARRWTRGGQPLHHVLDPRTGLPARVVWRTVSVAAPSCLAANIASTTAIIRGERAEGYLRAVGHAARLVGVDGSVLTLGPWPAVAP